MTTLQEINYKDNVTLKLKSDNKVHVYVKDVLKASVPATDAKYTVTGSAGIQYKVEGLNLYNTSNGLPIFPLSSTCTGSIPKSEQVQPKISSVVIFFLLAAGLAAVAFFAFYRGQNPTLKKFSSFVRGAPSRSHFPWKLIVVMLLLTAVIVVSFVRNRYKNTISVLGTSGYRYAFAAAYPMLSGLLGFESSQVPLAVTQWMEYGKTPTATDAQTITNLVNCSQCTIAEVMQCMLCGISPIANCTKAPTDCTASPCNCNAPPSPKPSTGHELLDAAYKYGLPILNTAIMLGAL